MPQDDTTNITDNNMTTDQVPSDTNMAMPVDANAIPVDANAMPVDANAMPMDANAMPMDANAAVPQYAATPGDPNAVQGAPAFDPTMPFYSDTIVMPGAEQTEPEEKPKAPVKGDVRADIASKLGESKNVLIALSGDPSVDELSAAIGLSLYLDRIGKRATAIYSGVTPNALEFLKPEETFEASADTLQDFVIAINKDKADHLRYKLDGDYVKVYITPYKHRLSEADLEFSYGDYNVDFVIALDVSNGIDLDSALREHGRIMHDASIVNVTTGNPGKFGEIEWSDKKASSVSEMISELLYEFGGENPIAKDEATAFLTGVVAATNRFSNTKTTPETMRLCSKLMESGANQVLVSKNVTPDTENEIFNAGPAKAEAEQAEAEPKAAEEKKEEKDKTKLDIEHEYEQRAKEAEGKPGESEDSPEEINADVTKKEHTLLDDLKAAEESLSHTGQETTEVNEENKLNIENGHITSAEVGDAAETSDKNEAPIMEIPKGDTESTADGATKVDENEGITKESEKVIAPTSDFDPNGDAEGSDKYGQMLQNALDSTPESVEPTSAITSEPDSDENPAAMNAPVAPTAPEINGVPEMNFSQASDEILPPPPAPPVDGASFDVPPVMDGENGMFDQAALPPAPDMETPVASDPAMPAGNAESVQPIPLAVPAVEPEPVSVGEQSAMQDQVYSAQQNDPNAFKIPGM